MSETALFAGFIVFVLIMLAVDLGVFHRKTHTVSFREAIGWTIVWITLALAFNGALFYTGTPHTPEPREAGLMFLTGYVIEKALSVDNIFVFAVLFTYFRVPPAYQHKILFWGILGALVMRGFFIWAGIELINRFHWTIYIFGALLVFTGIKMLVADNKEVDPEHNLAFKIFRRFVPITAQYHGDRFWAIENGRRVATPMLVVLLLIETTDLIFAVDSVPAVIAVMPHPDPFIVFTSNVFAILGLRALYFVLAGMLDKFRYLGVGLSFILMFVGVKMLISEFYKLPTAISLGVVALVLGLAIAISLIVDARKQDKAAEKTAESDPAA